MLVSLFSICFRACATSDRSASARRTASSTFGAPVTDGWRSAGSILTLQ
jgi:hypothetical protein